MSGPVSMGREDVAKWLYREFVSDNEPFRYDAKYRMATDIADAVIALVEEVIHRTLVEVDRVRESLDDDETRTIVSRVMGRA